jgi:hypothetical protein
LRNWEEGGKKTEGKLKVKSFEDLSKREKNLRNGEK